MLIHPLLKRRPSTARRTLWQVAWISWLTWAASGASTEPHPPVAPPPIEVKTLEATGLTNLFRIGPELYSGAVPEGDAGFATLRHLGVRTVISVDGARPEIDRAHRFGLRYIHLPFGYDGIPKQLQAQLIQAVRSQPGPFYIHCHHGQHRGPTAAAVITLANARWTSAQAEHWLHTAGTATRYIGLYESVRHFQAPTDAELRRVPAVFPETAPVPALVDAMVQIDQRMDHLKAIRRANYQAPPNQPDLQPSNELTLLVEHFRESQRLPEIAARSSQFRSDLESAETEVREAEIRLARYLEHPELGARRELDKALDTVSRRCQNCHNNHRDTPNKPQK